MTNNNAQERNCVGCFLGNVCDNGEVILSDKTLAVAAAIFSELLMTTSACSVSDGDLGELIRTQQIENGHDGCFRLIKKEKPPARTQDAYCE